MKKFYAALFIVCVILTITSIPPVPSEVPFTDRLRYHSDKWELRLIDPDHSVFRIDSERGKEKLISYLENHHRKTVSIWWAISTSLIATILCLVGWIREKSRGK